MKALSFIREIFRKYPLLLIVTTLLVVCVSIIEACSLFTVGPLIDFLINPDLKNAGSVTGHVARIMNFVGLPVTLGAYLLIMIAFIVLSSIFRIFAKQSILKTKYAFSRDLYLGTFEDFFNARWYFFSSSKQGTLLNTFIREVSIVGDAFGAMAYLFSDILQLAFYLAVPFYISWQVTLTSFIVASVLSLPFIFLGKACYRLGQLNTTTSNKIGSVIEENFSLAKVVLGFGNQKKSIDNLASAFDAHRQTTVKSQTIDIIIPVLYRPIGVIVLAVALFSARGFGVPLSEIAILLLALLQSVITIGSITTRKTSLDNFFPSYEQIKNLRAKANDLKQSSGSKVFAGFNSQINIEGVSFTYPKHEPVLRDINIRIPKGKMVAFVGESGAGKSTLIDMIMGFNDPLTGQITFDGINLKEFDIVSYRRRIGYVPQDSVLFNMTIRDNLLWAKDNATEQEIRYACQLANAEEFITNFPYGYDTLVGDRGVRLSGGQRQRVALARAILRKPELLILDEATSSLDTNSERLIQKAIENIAKETTIIVIAHRLSTIVNSDYVYVFKKGEVVEHGTYQNLTKIDGHFNNMVKLQLLEMSASRKE